MTSPILAGQKIRGYDLNNLLPVLVMATADTSRVSSTVLLDATGLALPVEADAAYVIDGYIAYDSNATADFKAAFTAPSGAAGHWTLYGLGSATTGSVGDIGAFRSNAWTTAISAGGSDSFSGTLGAIPRGYLATDVAGTLQLQFAQNNSNVNATWVRTGSWLRAVRVA